MAAGLSLWLWRSRCRALLSRPAGAVRAHRGLAARPEMHFGFQSVTEEERREKSEGGGGGGGGKGRAGPGAE